MLMYAIIVAASAFPLASHPVGELSSVLAVDAVTMETSGEANISAWPTDPLPPGTNSSNIVSSLVRLGLDPDAIAAAGLSPSNAAALVASAVQALDQFKLPLQEADAAVTIARLSASTLERRLVGGTASNEERAAWPSANQALSGAITARDGLLEVFANTLVETLSESQRNSIAQLRSNSPNWREIPAPYLVTTRSDPENVLLRDALTVERIALLREEEVPVESAQLLAQVRAEPAVSAAMAAWQANAILIKETWTAQAASPPTP